MVARLVTWDWMGNHAKVENKIVAILNYRLSSERVQEIVELLYVNEYLSLSERLAYAKDKKSNPYPAEFDSVARIRWRGRITCGHNPFLHARLVDGLHVAVDEEGEETLTWKERPGPNLQQLRKLTRTDR